MFPINLKMPKYAEGWIVSFSDKFIGTGEFLVKYKYKISYVLNLFIIMLINSVK